jgi:hypothetical protein
LSKYGYVPFIGLTAAALISKEAYIVDAETLLALNIGSFVMTAYVALGDGLQKAVADYNASMKEKFDTASDSVLGALNTYKTVVQQKVLEVEVMKEYNTEAYNAAVSYIGYSNAKVRWAAYNEMMAKLESIKAQEEAAEAAEYSLLVEGAVADVVAAFSGPSAANLRADAMKFAIDNIGQKPKPGADPVTKVFESTFNAK